MKVLLFYFSGLGYTRWVVNRFSSMLIQNGHSVHVEAVENCDIAEILKREDMIDSIGFAQPIYAADMPRIMRRAIHFFLDATKAYPALPTNVFFLNTYAYVNGYGYLEARKLFQNTSFRIQGYVNIKMPNSAPGKRNVIRSDNIPGEELAKDAWRRLAEFIARLENGKRYISGLGPQIFAGKLVRRALRKPILNTYTRLRVDAQRCTQCMRCVNTCPVQCIQVHDSAFTFTSACEACMRCVHACPARAISIK